MKIKLLILLFPVLVLKGCLSGNRTEVGKPNVVIIYIDDMGYADPSCFGNPLMHTPNIDALAENGMKFTNYYANSPICSPSRVALNTGKVPMRYRIHSYINWSYNNEKRAMASYLDPEAPTMARALQQNGYATAYVGKWHMGGGRDLADAPHPREYGFEKSFVAHVGWGDRLLTGSPTDDVPKPAYEDGEIVWTEHPYEITRIFIDSALSFIKQNSEGPFYLNLCPKDVHDPFNPAPGTAEKYKSVTDNPFQQDFLAVLEELDLQIGRFIKELENMGLLEKTIIIFTSDNGPTDWPYYYQREEYPDGYEGELYPPGFTGEFFGRKWSLYEGGIRMPFIIHWKGHIPAGETDDQTIIASTDLFPSICAIAGAEWPDGLDGKDKSQALLGTPMPVTDPIMWQYASNPGGTLLPGDPSNISPNLAIRQGDWKLLINVDSTGAELYNLDTDPGEKNNLIETERERAESLARQVIAWRRTMPVDIPAPGSNQ